jgi:hypothetical protein
MGDGGRLFLCLLPPFFHFLFPFFIFFAFQSYKPGPLHYDGQLETNAFVSKYWHDLIITDIHTELEQVDMVPVVGLLEYLCLI